MALATIDTNLHVRPSELAKELAEDSAGNHADTRQNIRLLGAVKQRNMSLVDSMIQDGIDINGTIKGASFLLLCIMDEDLDRVKALLTYGAQINTPCMPPSVLLLAAAIRRSTSILDLLLNQGDNINNILPEHNASYAFVGLVHPKLIRTSNAVPQDLPSSTLQAH